MMALAMAFVGETVPKESTGRTMGLLGTMSAIGTTLGPSLGGLLVAECGWRAIFLVNLPLGVLAIWLAYRQLPTDRVRPAADGSRFDVLGTVLLAAALGTYALAMTIGHGSFGVLNIGVLAAAWVGLALFTFVENTVASPLINLGAFRDPHSRERSLFGTGAAAHSCQAQRDGASYQRRDRCVEHGERPAKAGG